MNSRIWRYFIKRRSNSQLVVIFLVLISPVLLHLWQGQMTLSLGASGYITTGIAFLSMLYTVTAAIGLFVVLLRVVLPMKAIKRLQRLQQFINNRQQDRLMAAEQQYAALEDAITSISTTINTTSKLTSILEQIVHDATRTFHSDHIFVSLLEGQPQVLWVVAYKSSYKPRETALEHKFMGKEYLSGTAVHINNLAEHFSSLRPEIVRAGMNAMIGVPIMVDGKLAGVFEILFHTSEEMSDYKIKLAAIYAKQMSIAVKRAKQDNECSKIHEELTLLHEVVQVVNNQPSPVMLLGKVGKIVNDYVRADAFASFVVQRDTNPPLVKAVYVEDFPTDDVNQLAVIIAEGQLAGRWQKVASNNKPSQTALVQATLASGKTVSVLPLFFRRILQGAIVVYWDYDRKVNHASHTENTLVSIAIQTAMGLDRDNLYGSIKKIGLTDTLTDIANRRFFDYVLKRELNRARRYRRPLSLMMVDIDFFKKINDTWGHQTGDVILQEMGAMLKMQFRTSDVPARYGGEEFAVILPETSSMQAYAVAEKLRDQAAKKIFAHQTDRVSLTISIGVATIEYGKDADHLTEADLILAADQSLYRAKHAGRNRVEVCDWEWRNPA